MVGLEEGLSASRERLRKDRLNIERASPAVTESQPSTGGIELDALTRLKPILEIRFTEI